LTIGDVGHDDDVGDFGAARRKSDGRGGPRRSTNSVEYWLVDSAPKLYLKTETTGGYCKFVQ
jgi:hypothetical protein